MTQIPDWPTCGRDECWGIRWGEGSACLAHLDESDKQVALAELRPGADIDLRGTSISHSLLKRLLAALTPDGGEQAIFGMARFDGAQFTGRAEFKGAQFTAGAVFTEAQFNEYAEFTKAQLSGYAVFFRGAQFSGHAAFDEAQFSAHALFSGAQFGSGAGFATAQFNADAEFTEAKFSGHAVFNGAQINGRATFLWAQFSKDAEFASAQFREGCWFIRAQFNGLTSFGGAQFGIAVFSEARFDKDAYFGWTTFNEDAHFTKAQFGGNAQFDNAQFAWNALFDEAQFADRWDGTLVCRQLSAQRAVVTRLQLRVAAGRIGLSEARLAAPAVLDARYALVDLAGAAVEAPLTLASPASPISDGRHEQGFLENGVFGPSRATLASLRGVDAANIVLLDVDLSQCVFAGARNLDQIRLEGQCVFGSAPRGWRVGRALIPARRWTARKVLAEETAWRASSHHSPALARAGWGLLDPGEHKPVPETPPAQLAVLYRALRKALEDGKNSPGAADFYFGEMEARRHDPGAPRGERWLLHAYWLLSGYALRASRALGFLAVTATVTFLLMLAVGLPDSQPSTQITGTIPLRGGTTVLTEAAPNPALDLPWAERFTADRAEQAALVVVNSVIFRTTNDTFTTPGTWIEIVSRIGEPVLLGFAAVAARGRVQR